MHNWVNSNDHPEDCSFDLPLPGKWHLDRDCHINLHQRVGSQYYWHIQWAEPVCKICTNSPDTTSKLQTGPKVERWKPSIDWFSSCRGTWALFTMSEASQPVGFKIIWQPGVVRFTRGACLLMSHLATLITIPWHLTESATVANPCKEVEMVGGAVGTKGKRLQVRPYPALDSFLTGSDF